MSRRYLSLIAVAVLSSLAPAADAGSSGPVLCLTFEKSREGKQPSDASLIQDACRRDRQAIVRGSPDWVAGKFGFGLRLADGDYIEVPPGNDFDNLRGLTVEGWFYPEDVQSESILVSKWDHPERRSFILYSKPGGLVEWGVGWTKSDYLILRDGCALAADQWQHVAGTWDGPSGAIRLFRNGSLARESKTPNGLTLINSTVPLLIGTHNNNPGAMENFSGAVSRIRAWNRALTAEEIKTAYDREKGEFTGPIQVRPAVQPAASAPVNVGSDKRLFLDESLIEKKDGVTLTMNRPRLTGEKCIVAEKPWEAGAVHPFGDSVMEDDQGTCRMYYPSWDKKGRLWFCMATSKDGVRWEKPELGVVPFEGSMKTNIVYPDASCPKMAMFFGTCVFKDANPKCPPEQRYKMINGDTETWVFGSPDGVRFKPLYSQPSFRPSDTNNILFFDERIGQYVAYMRIYAPWRKVVRCVTSDLAKFGPERVVFSYDKQDQARLDKNRFVCMDFYNSSAIRYPYAADAYLMFPSAYYHFPEPPAGKLSNDGITDIHLATSPDGVRWTRVSREPFIPLQAGQNGLYMAWGMIRRGDKLYLYYGIYHWTHGAPINPADYITRAELRLDGFVSLDAASRGTITTVPLVFSGSRLELNVAGQTVRVALLDASGNALKGFGLADCDAITGDHTAKTVRWRGKSDLRQFAGKTVRVQVELTKAKLYAFQFAK